MRALDARLALSIERQQRIRDDLSDLLTHRTGPDVPVGFESIADSLTGSDRARQSYLLVQEDSPSDRVGR